MTDPFTVRYTNKINEYCDAPTIFIKASSYHLLSTLLGRFFQSLRLPGSKDGGRPNVWFLISSIPGRMRRSTVHNYDNFIYRNTLSNFFGRLEDKKKLITASIIDEGTPEGIADHVNENPDIKHYDIQSPEFGGVLIKTKSGGYEYGLPVILSKLYYGEDWNQLLSQRSGNKNRYIPPNLYVTMFAGMQEPGQYLNEGMIRQGLLRRIMICYVTPNMMNMSNWIEPIKDERCFIWELLHSFSIELTEKMQHFNRIYHKQENLIDITFHPRVVDAINNCARKNDAILINEEPTNLNIFQQSQWEHLAKLSMLEAISHGKTENIGGEDVIFVSIDDFNRAKEFFDEFTKTNELIVESILESEKIKTEKKPLDRIYNIIVKAGQNGIKRSELYRKANLAKTKLDEFINTLITQSRITTIKRRTDIPGPSSSIYVANRFLAGIQGKK